MIILPTRDELRPAVAKIIADVCRCDEQPLLENQLFIDVIEHYDSLAMLEILLGIETQFNVNTDDLLPSELRTQDEIAELFPQDLDSLVEHIYSVAERVNTAEAEEKAVVPTMDTQNPN